MRRKLGRRTTCPKIHGDEAQVDWSRVVECEHVGCTEVEGKQDAVTDEKETKVRSDWQIRGPTSRVVLDDDLVVIVHRHNASPAHRPTDCDRIRRCRAVRPPAASIQALNMNASPARARDRGDQAVWCENHRSAR